MSDYQKLIEEAVRKYLPHAAVEVTSYDVTVHAGMRDRDILANLHHWIKVPNYHLGEPRSVTPVCTVYRRR